MRRVFILIFLISTGSTALFGTEKRPLDFTDYDDWKNLKNYKIYPDGHWVTYEINPQQGDGYLYLYNTLKGRLDSVPRGRSALFSPENDFVVFRLVPPADTLRAMELAGKKKDKMPKDSLCVWNLNTAAKTFFAGVNSFRVPYKGANWLSIKFDKSTVPKDTLKRKFKSEGTPVLLFRPATGDTLRLEHVTQYDLAREGKGGYFVESLGDSVEETRVHRFDANRWTLTQLFQRAGNSAKITSSDKADQAALLYSPDTTSVKTYRLLYRDDKSDGFSTIVDTMTAGLDSGYCASRYGPLYFSRNGKRLFFGVQARPVPEPKDTLTDDEKAHVDIWNWKDLRLQPMQKKQLESDKKRTYLSVYHPRQKEVIQLAHQQVFPVTLIDHGNGDYALGYDSTPYLRASSWTGKRLQDVYLTDVNTGAQSLLQQAVESTHGLSPDGRYFYWYAPQDSNYYVMDVIKRKTRLLTGDIDVPLYNDWHDEPSEPRPFGVAGWSADNRYLLVYDRFDIWKFDATGKEPPLLLTHGGGRQKSIQLRYVRLDTDELAIELSRPLLLSAFQIYTKQSGFYRLFNAQLSALIMEDVLFGRPVKARETETLLVQKGDFNHSPELYLTNTKLEDLTPVSTTNPQQKEYRWGNIRLVSWAGFNGEVHQGLLVTPEDMDSTRKHPMVLYFYERSSDRLHNYYAPAPSRSTINWTFYASNGYVVFVPDITYRTGDPGLSAYEAIMSGTQTMLERFPFIDADNMGLQGQSWGGYQTAFMVTRTNRFKAAMAGAPVSNMTSAYGAIRWGTGRSRMSQYEHTQSRIGATLWEDLPKYIENSPLFFVPQIETPLLMMHNDNDGAVPWYQSIELFTAMRRLNKPAWLLVYNNEEHNLTRRADSKDLSRRMMQFFDHYLKGKSAPQWMEKGVTALEKEL